MVPRLIQETYPVIEKLKTDLFKRFAAVFVDLSIFKMDKIYNKSN